MTVPSAAPGDLAQPPGREVHVVPLPRFRRSVGVEQHPPVLGDEQEDHLVRQPQQFVVQVADRDTSVSATTGK
jgi:hypothetical protein